MGGFEFEVGELMGSLNQSIQKKLVHGGKEMGTLILRADKVEEQNNLVSFQIRLDNVKKSGWFSSPKPFVKFARPRINAYQKKLAQNGEAGFDIKAIKDWVKVYESEHLPKTQGILKMSQINSSKLCYSLNFLPIKLQLFKYKSNGSHKLLGEVHFTLNQIQSGNKNFQARDEKGGVMGDISFVHYKEEVRHSFVQYLKGGLQINLVTCIDFTGSNLDPSDPRSLHRMTPGGLNQYQKAIQSVGEILLNYDHDKVVPVYGFGAKLNFPSMNQQQVSHFFPCSGDFNNPAGQGIVGCFALYQNAINYTQLAGPTLFAPLLSEVNKFTAAKAQINPFNYTVLLILTDGVIHDMDETIAQVIESSYLPLSIIIVGVGKENFSQMHALDSDDSVRYHDLIYSF